MASLAIVVRAAAVEDYALVVVGAAGIVGSNLPAQGSGTKHTISDNFKVQHPALLSPLS